MHYVCVCGVSALVQKTEEKNKTGECPATGGKPREELKKHVMMTPGLSAPGTLHLNDITQTHRQNNTSAVKYKQDRLSEAANRWPDGWAVCNDRQIVLRRTETRTDRQAQGHRLTDRWSDVHAVSLLHATAIADGLPVQFDHVEEFGNHVMAAIYKQTNKIIHMHLNLTDIHNQSKAWAHLIDLMVILPFSCLFTL